MLDQNWIVVSAVCCFVGAARYAYATVRGLVSPNRVTWVLWALAPLVAFIAQLDGGVGAPAALTLVAGVGPLIVLAASFATRHGSNRMTRLDLACGTVSIVALIAWSALGHAQLAVILAVIADAAAATPTVRKAWRNPISENALFYVLVGTGAIITLLTIDFWTPASWMFAGYMLALSLVLTTIIVIRRTRCGVEN